MVHLPEGALFVSPEYDLLGAGEWVSIGKGLLLMPSV